MNLQRLTTIGRRALLVLGFALIASGAEQDWMRVAARAQGPDARAFHSAVYEPQNRRMIVFGGRGSAGHGCAALNDTWTLTHPSGATGSPSWIRLAPDGLAPSARYSHTAVYDADTDRMIVFGGSAADGCAPMTRSTAAANDVWILQNASGAVASEGVADDGTAPEAMPAWIPLKPVGTPPPSREAHTAIYDPATNRMVVFGGTNLTGSCAGAIDDLWVLSNANGLGGTPEWTRVNARGVAPSTRRGHTAVFDAATDRMILFGGESRCAGEVNDLFVLEHPSGVNGSPTWFRGITTSTSPRGRAFHTAVYDSTANRMTIFGGGTRQDSFADVWVLTNANGLSDELSRWEKSASGDVVPSPRVGHTSMLDVASQRVTIFGGSSRAGIGERGLGIGRAAGASDASTLRNDLSSQPGRVGSASSDTWTLRDGLLVDTLPPVILTLSASPTPIPYANRRLVAVDLSVAVTDEYDPNPTCAIVTATSSVAPLGGGQDWLITGPLRVHLRSERPRGGVFDNRTYTITVRCIDESGHSATRSIDVKTAPPKGLEEKSRRVAMTN